MTGSMHAICGVFCAVTFAVQSGCAVPGDASAGDVTDANRELVRASFERWRQGAGGPFELLASDAQWTIVGSSPISKTYSSRQEFLDEVIAPFNRRLAAPLVPTVRGLWADGDAVVVLFDGAATAKDGKPYRNTYSWHLWVRDSRVVRAVAFFDTRVFDEFWNRVSPVP